MALLTFDEWIPVWIPIIEEERIWQLCTVATAATNNEEEKMGDNADTSAAASNEGGPMDLVAPVAEAGEMNN